MMQSVKHLLWYATTFKELVVQAARSPTARIAPGPPVIETSKQHDDE